MKPMWKALKRHRYAYLFISPYLILFLVFQLVPTVSTIYYSFTEWNGLRPPRWIGWRNYQLMFRDYMFRDAVRNTFLYWIVGTIGIMTLAMGIALALNTKKLRLKHFFKTATFLPYVCASVAMGLIFRMLFEEHVGLVNEIIALFGGERVPWLASSKYAWFPVVTLFIWRLTPWFTMIILWGCSIFLKNTMRQHLWTAPQLGSVLCISPCRFWATFSSSALLPSLWMLGASSTNRMSFRVQAPPTLRFELMYRSAFTNFRLGYGSALGVVLVVILLALSLIQFVVRRRTGEI